MDSAAYLQRHGWRGHGHSLDQHGKGIKKPLLVSKKVDALGLGLNKHQAVSDQWWLRAFDQGLKDLGSGKQSLLASVKKHGINRGGLYGRFVKGEDVPGTIGISATSSGISTPTKTHPTRVSEEEETEDERVKLKQKRKREERQSKRKKRKSDGLDEEQKQGVDNKIKSQIDAQCTEILYEAVRRGFIPPSPGDIRKGIVPRAEAGCLSENDMLSQIISKYGVKFPSSINGPIEKQNTEREALKRALKRAAKAYFKNCDISEHTRKKHLKLSNDIFNGATATSDQIASEPLSKKRRYEECQPIEFGHNTVAQQPNDYVDNFEMSADEIKLERKKNDVSGVNGTSWYKNHAKRKTKNEAVDNISALVAGADFQRSHKDAISSEKWSQYEQRAQKKGLTVEAYIQRRQEKKLAKNASTS